MVVVGRFALRGSQRLVRVECEVCPEVEVSGEVGCGDVVSVEVDGLDDVETVKIEGRHIEAEEEKSGVDKKSDSLRVT